MSLDFPDKAAARQHVWDRLKAEKLAAFPFPPHGRIPNFKGAADAARRLFDLPTWRDARRIKVNPDSPQTYVRAEALRRGIVVYVPTPKLAGGFKKLDPDSIPADAAQEAAKRSNWARWAVEVPLDELPQMDAIVAGSVAVTRDGRRAGKGAGYSDLEFAILMELGHKPVPVATTVHEAQLVDGFPIEPIDQPLAAIATPARAFETGSTLATPRGIDWSRLTEDDLEAMPIVRELQGRGRKKGAG